MSTKAKRHIHKYRKVEISGTKVWRCALPDCAHYMPKHLENMVEGRYSYCWNCGNEMILDSENMKLDDPICYGCKNGKVESETVTIPANFDIDSFEIDKNKV